MWPFTSRRIFGNRWWAVGFVGVICWQVADLFDRPSPAGNPVAVTDTSGAPVDDEQMRQMTETLNTLQNSD